AVTDNLSFSTAGTARMNIDNLGNVGVGMTAPTQQLEVNGGIKANIVILNGSQATSGSACANSGAIAIDAAGDLYICK
ncbi:MAG: hypothetical protein ACXVA9_13795, partial [Bdellovibrionales bacterium]